MIMRQIRIYKFDDLPEDVKQDVLESRRDEIALRLDECTDGYYSESVKAFCNEFGIRVVRDNVGYPGTFVDYEFEDNEIYPQIYADDVTGRLLWRYLMRHYDDMVKPKTYYGNFGEWNPKKQQYNVKTRRSCVVYDASYSGIYERFSLTGTYSDWALLKPIVEWLHHPDDTTSLSELLQECLDAEYEEWNEERERNYSNDELIMRELSELDNAEYSEDGSVLRVYAA